jgi:TPR repeat protein
MLRAVVLAMTLIVGLIPWQASAQDEASLRGGVVKIMSVNLEGMRRTGTGFVVKAEGKDVYIVTAAHVVEGDPNPQVEFFTRQNTPVRAVVRKQDQRYDLALLKVESPQQPMILELETSTMPRVGDEVTTIGFPRTGGAWLVSRADLSGRDGVDLILSGGAIDEGNSGGPVIKGGKVIGVVHELKEKFAKAMPASVVVGTLEGWDVAMAADVTKPASEDAKGAADAQTGSIDYSNFAQVKKAAERGDPKAMDVLGDMYAQGQGVQENFAQAARWYRRSADAGYSGAFAGMGILTLVKAMGLASDDESAVRLYNDESKKWELWRLLFHPQEYPVRNQVELKEAVRWLRRGADDGHDPVAQIILAQLTSGGVGVEKDPVQAAKWMRLAATKLSLAQVMMGKFYFDGTGVKQDYTEAVRRFRDAADKNEPEAYTWLGLMYMQGHGVVQDHAEAAKWLRKGVDQHDPDAKALLGTLYFTGRGVPQDFTAAYILAKETAELGHSTGQYLLGLALFTGKGAPQNYQEGVKWMQVAARKGHREAQQILQEQGLSW